MKSNIVCKGVKGEWEEGLIEEKGEQKGWEEGNREGGTEGGPVAEEGEDVVQGGTERGLPAGVRVG